MHRRGLLLILACLALCLTGCAATSADSGEVSPSAAPTVSATPTPSPAPTTDPTLIVSLDGLTLEGSDVIEAADYGDAAAVLALLEEITGTKPEVNRDPTYPITFYNWPGVRAIVGDEGPASVAITASEIGGLPVQTPEGLEVGSSRREALAAGAWEGEWDGDGDGFADFLGVGSREVPGTESLTHPGSVGIQYLFLLMNGDAIEQIQAPSNDFSDI